LLGLPRQGPPVWRFTASPDAASFVSVDLSAATMRTVIKSRRQDDERAHHSVRWSFRCGFTAAGRSIEEGLKESVDRLRGAKRAFVVCSRSVNQRTDTVRRIEAALGDRYAGVFDGIEKGFDVRLGARGEAGRGRARVPTC
jgi:hypothetical protein